MDKAKYIEALRALADRLERGLPDDVVSYLGEDGRVHTVNIGERVPCLPKSSISSSNGLYS